MESELYEPIQQRKLFAHIQEIEYYPEHIKMLEHVRASLRENAEKLADLR